MLDDSSMLPPLKTGLRVLQWNILLDSDQPGCVDDDMKRYVTPVECLDWSVRCQTIASRVQQSNVDVAYLEECSPSMFVDLKHRLSEYNGWHAADLDSGPHNDSIEVAIFTRLATVDVLGTPWCRKLYSLCEEGSERETVLIPHEDSGDIPPSAYVVLSAAVRQRLEDTSDNAVLVIAGTHLRWEYGDGFGGAAAAKPLQALAAVRHLMQHVADTGAKGWALVGDFNSRPDDAAYELITVGKLPKDHSGLLSLVDRDLVLPDGRPLSSAFKLMHDFEPKFTRKKNSPASEFSLDYVFIGGGTSVVAAGFGAGPPPYDDDVTLPFLPNAEWPSDHLPIVVDLSFPAI